MSYLHKARAALKHVRVSAASSPGRYGIGLFSALLIFTTAFVWLYAPASTAAAQFAWNHFQAGEFALALDKGDAGLALEIGTNAFGVGGYNLPLAERAFREAVALDPGILWGHYQLARVLFVIGDLRGAEVEIDKELSYNPGNLRALYVRGLVYAYGKRLSLAAADFERFTQWAPSEWAGYNDLAWVLGQEGNYEEAKAALERGFRYAAGADKNPWLWNNLGVQELSLKEYGSALISFEKAQTFSASLDAQQWKAAYPGNDPSRSAKEIQAFRDAIATNIMRARSGS